MREDAAVAAETPGAVARIVAWSTRHRAVTILAWFLLVAVAIVGGGLLAGGSVNSTDPGEAGRAERIINRPGVDVPTSENVLIQARAGAAPFVANAELGRTTADLVTTLTRTGAVTQVRSPLAADHQGLISRDGTAGLVTFQIAGPIEEFDSHYTAATGAVQAVAARHPAVRVAQAGDHSLSKAVDESIKDDFHRAEYVSLPLTVVILVVVFGSLLAAGIPLLLAATSVAATFGLLQVVDNVVPVNSAASSMILLIGMAVAIDYSLFYLRREREERLAGRSVRDALRVAASTSGRVVVVSGCTVIVCLSGLIFTGLDVFRGVAAGVALVVGLAVLGSATVLPALLAALGHWVDRARVPWLGRRRTTARESKLWWGIASVVVRRPLRWGGLAGLLLVVIALPALGMHLQDAARTESLPRSVPTVDAAVRLQEKFPGAASPAWVVLWNPSGDPVDTPAVRAAIDGLRTRSLGPVSVDRLDPAGRVLMVRVPLAGAGTDEVSNAALSTLRQRVLPASFGQLAGVKYAVAGRTAIAHDFAVQLRSHAALVIGFVLALALALLLWTFRSPALALASIGLNLLSIAAALGVLTWIFQDGHLGSVLGFTSYGGVVGWLPLFMFVLLFGLSMDYHIFILSRIRERRAAGADYGSAIIGGIGTSAGVVTSAAVIMISVFGVFVSLTAIEYKMLGIGMAVAILIDATIVRGVLLPAAIALLGRRAWPADSEPSRVPEIPTGVPSEPVAR